MAAYRRVYGFGHLRADCRGPESGSEYTDDIEYGTSFTFINLLPGCCAVVSPDPVNTSITTEAVYYMMLTMSIRLFFFLSLSVYMCLCHCVRM